MAKWFLSCRARVRSKPWTAPWTSKYFTLRIVWSSKLLCGHGCHFMMWIPDYGNGGIGTVLDYFWHDHFHNFGMSFNKRQERRKSPGLCDTRVVMTKRLKFSEILSLSEFKMVDVWWRPPPTSLASMASFLVAKKSIVAMVPQISWLRMAVTHPIPTFHKARRQSNWRLDGSRDSSCAHSNPSQAKPSN